MTILFIALAAFSSAQNEEAAKEEARKKARDAQRAAMRSPAMRETQKSGMKRMMRSLWTGENSNLIVMRLLENDDSREGLGISKEQNQKIQDQVKNVFANIQGDPAFKPIQDEMEKLREANPSGLFGENASEETQKKFSDLQMKLQDAMLKKMNDIVNENLTPKQMKKVKEFQISIMSEIPIFSPNMFEALDLSEGQKKQLGDIKKELEPEFEVNLNRLVDTHAQFAEKLQDEIGDQLEGVTDPEERKKIMERVTKKIRESNPGLQKMENEVMESGKAFINKLKFKMFDVLSDEQMERMGELIDNPPDYVKRLIERMHKEMGSNDAAGSSGEWQPGLNSWKPGEPIPEEYRKERQERKNRFPKKQ